MPTAAARKRRIPASRENFVNSLWKAGEAQAKEITSRINEGPVRPAEDTERDVRTLSVLAKTLRELAAAEMGWRVHDQEREEEAPDDIEALRAALEARLSHAGRQRGAVDGASVGA